MCKLTKANAQSRKTLFAVHLPDFYTSKKFVVVTVQTKKEPFAQHTLNTATVHVVCYLSDSQCCVYQEKGSLLQCPRFEYTWSLFSMSFP